MNENPGTVRLVRACKRTFFAGFGCLGLGWAVWSGLGAAAAQPPPGERAAPRVGLKPVPAADAELLPGLPSGEFARRPRPPGPAAVMALPPDIPPLGLPSDGEAAPSFPDLPDLPESSLLPQSPADDAAPGAAAPLVPEDGAPPGLAPGAAVSPAAAAPAPADPALSFPVWHESPKKARALAEAERRCLLLVFSGSQSDGGGTARQLSDEVFSTPAFNEFALQHLVICGLFYSRSSSLDLNDPALLARGDALASIKKAFRVRGFPCVILLGPDGKEIDRWNGYLTGRGAGYLQRLRQAVEGHEAVLFETERRRERLAAKGYRTWTSARGTPLFARLIEFDAHTALLRDEAGADRKVSLKQLALPDREIITRQRLGKPMPERAPASPSAETTLR